MILLVTIFGAFTFLGVVQFGGSRDEFSGPYTAAETLFNLMIGEVRNAFGTIVGMPGVEPVGRLRRLDLHASGFCG